MRLCCALRLLVGQPCRLWGWSSSHAAPRSHCDAAGAVTCSSRLGGLSSALGCHCAAGWPQRMARGCVGWFRPVGRRNAAGVSWRHYAAVASNTGRLSIPQPQRKSCNSAKSLGISKTVTASEELTQARWLVCLVEACGSAPLPLQTPDAVHAHVVLVAWRAGG